MESHHGSKRLFIRSKALFYPIMEREKACFQLISVPHQAHTIQTNQWPMEAWLLGWQTGLYSAVLISINNLRDCEEDSGTGKRTLAVRFGARFTKLVIGFEILGAALSGMAWIAFGYAYLALASLPTVLIGFRILRDIIHLPPGPAYNRLLSSAGIQLLLFATAYHIIAKLT